MEVLCLLLLTCTRLTEYNEIKRKLEQLSALYQVLKDSYNGGLLEGTTYSQYLEGIVYLTFAEIGHSTLKRKKQLMLVDAAWEDVTTVMLQKHEHTAFLQKLHQSMGKGPSIPQIATKEKKHQRKRSRDYQ